MSGGGTDLTELRVLVGTTDYDGTTAFYRDVLGFPADEAWDGPDGRGTLFRATSAGIVEVVEDSPHHPAVPPVGVSVAIEVDDVDAVHDRLRLAGVTIAEPIADRPWGHRNFAIRDPSGLPLTFFEVLSR